MLDGTYLSRNFATLGPTLCQPPWPLRAKKRRLEFPLNFFLYIMFGKLLMVFFLDLSSKGSYLSINRPWLSQENALEKRRTVATMIRKMKEIMSEKKKRINL
jgi:hypothetical protein